jgi:hypothetical protein
VDQSNSLHQASNDAKAANPDSKGNPPIVSQLLLDGEEIIAGQNFSLKYKVPTEKISQQVTILGHSYTITEEFVNGELEVVGTINS